MKKIILIVVLLLVLGVGVIGGLSAFGMGPFPDLLHQSKTDTATKDAPPPPPAVKDRTYDLGTFIIPLVSSRAIGRQVGMDLSVVVTEAAAPKIGAQLPRLQNAILVDLYDFVPQHADTRSETDREAIHQHLRKVADKMFGDNAIRDVVIKSLYDR